jgi:hypothetical protein
MKVDELLQGARDAISVRRVYGEPLEAEGVTVVPAAIVVGGAFDAWLGRHEERT